VFPRALPLLLFVFLSVTLAKSGDPLNGRWLLDQSKAKVTGKHLQSVEIEADESRFKALYQGVDDNGQPEKWTIQATIGGNLSGVLDVPWLDAVRCWRSDARTVLLKLSRSAETIGWETLELSKDGKTLRLTHAVLDAKGKENKTITVFARE
jgi:hypothetical protein